MMTLPEPVAAYFARATAADAEPWFALFADDAHVEDDGRTYDGIDAIRAWRTAVPDVTYTITDATTVDDGLEVVASVAGAFPGSPVALRYRFVAFDATHIRDLRIAP